MIWRGNSAARRRSGTACAGFTLLEMIIVLVILGLMLGLFAARGPLHSQGLDLRTAAEELAQSLRDARGQAIAAGELVDVRWEQGGFRISHGRLHPLPGVSIAARTLGGQAQSGVRFAPDGSSSGGVIALADRAGRISIGVDWLTGRVRITDAP
jgi:general secretion pathway protein H